MTATPDSRQGSFEQRFSRAAIALVRNPLTRSADGALWECCLEQRGQLDDYFRKLGLELMVDETDGFAYLRQRDYLDGDEELPRIVPRFQLSYSVSLLLVLLRKRLLESDSEAGDNRLILSREQIVDMVRLFLEDSSNEAKVVARIASDIETVRKLGFLRSLAGSEDSYEVQRIIRGFITAEWLAEMDGKLQAYFAEE